MNVPKLRFKEFTGEWKEKSFRDIVSLNLVPTEKPSSDYVRLGIRSHCKGTFHEIVKIENVLEADKIFLVPKDNLILNITFAWEHAIAITDENDEGKYVSGRFPTFSFKSEELPAFYESIIRSKRMKYELGVASPGGAGRNRVLNKELFLDIPVNTTNIEEQTKISNFIRCVDDKIKNQKDIIESLEKQKKGLMQKIFSQELRFKDEDGKEFPAWEEKKLGEVGVLKNGIAKGKEFFGTGKKFINLQDVFGKTKLYFNDYGLVEVTDKELEENNLRKGDVLFVRSSVKPEGVGLSCVVMEDLLDTVFSGFIIRCRFSDTSIIDINYSTYCFLESNFRTELLKKSSSSANTNINQDNLANLRFKLPCIKEQQKIAEILSALDAKIELENQKLEHWQQIKKGLLQQMFV